MGDQSCTHAHMHTCTHAHTGTVYFQQDSPFLIVSAFCVYSVASALFMFPYLYLYYQKALQVRLSVCLSVCAWLVLHVRVCVCALLLMHVF